MSIMMSLFFLQAAATTATSETASIPSDDAKIVCKTVTPTGSRLGGQRICLPKREWRRLHETGQEATRDMQDAFSKQPGNQ
jgi:hypothetical protein